ncbi:MAG: outer membrane beta-barrel protein [Terriglobales bacterium]
MSNRILLLVVCCGLVASASAQLNFDHLTFNAGGGLGLGRDDVAAFVGNSGQVEAGAGFNLNRLFSVDAEYMYYNLGFKQTVKLEQSLVGQNGHMQSISLDGIVNVPKHVGKFGAYGIFGIGFYDRTVSVPRHFLQAGTVYQPAWLWWDLTWVDNIQGGQLNPQYISSNSKVAGGFNCGGGITYRLYHHSETASKFRDNAKLYVEWRYHRAYQSDGKTIVMPITVGFRW